LICWRFSSMPPHAILSYSPVIDVAYVDSPQKATLYSFP
jgi:hypothetical protein